MLKGVAMVRAHMIMGCWRVAALSGDADVGAAGHGEAPQTLAVVRAVGVNTLPVNTVRSVCLVTLIYVCGEREERQREREREPWVVNSSVYLICVLFVCDA